MALPVHRPQADFPAGGAENFGPIHRIETPLEHAQALWPGFAIGNPFGNKSVLRNRSLGESGTDSREQLLRRSAGTHLTGHAGARCDELLFVRSNSTPQDKASDIGEIKNYLSRLEGQDDKFLSVNTFFGRRRHENLKCLTALMVDLDLGKAASKGSDYQGDFMRLRQDALDLLSGAGIPSPNFAVHSGKGVHLYWLFDQIVPAKAFPRWRVCMKVMIDLLAKVGADEAVKDATRVLRLVGTINTTAPMHCRRVTAEVLVSSRYSFDFLADQILPLTRSELDAQRLERAKKLLDIGPEQARRRVTVRPAGSGETKPGRRYSATAIDRLGDLSLLAKTAYPEGVHEGSRDKYLFAATCHLAWICRSETLEAQMLAWKSEHVPSITDDEAKLIMGAAIRRAHAAHEDIAAGIFKSVFDDARYVLSAGSLWEQFGDDINRAGLLDQMKVILPMELRLERKKAAQKAKSADHYTGQGIRQSNMPKAQRAHELKSQGLSLRGIAEQLGVAPKTVGAWLAIELNPAKDPAQPHVTPPPHSSPPASESYPQANTTIPLLPKSSLNNGEAKQFSPVPSLMGPALLKKIEKLRPKSLHQAPSEQLSLIGPVVATINDAKPIESVERKVWIHDQAVVVALRQMPIEETLRRLGLYFKMDVGYSPKDSAKSTRLHVTMPEGHVIELVCTGLLWFDKSGQKGAFGSIDLAMHLMGWTVREALAHLHPEK
jgi:hypothetical protein